jgi:N-acetylmuramoyl-L-alanine amidase
VRTDSRLERDGELSRLTLTLLAPGRVAAAKASVAAPPPEARPFAPPVSQPIALPEQSSVVAEPLDAPMAPPAAEPVAAKQAPAANPPAARPGRTVRDVLGDGQRKLVVAIDAGHGGKDPGALGPSGVREKNVTLATARELARQINADPGMRAVLIRDGDTFVPLKQRYMKARAAQADLFISIHADAAQNDAANGASVFVLSTRGASSQAARWLADQENAADLDISLAQAGAGRRAELRENSEMGRRWLAALSKTGPSSASV